MTRIVPALACAGAVLALTAVPAGAAEQRYVSPTGSGTDCSEDLPCDLETGVEGAVDGDEVIVAPGNYGTPESPMTDTIGSTADIDIHGVDGQPRPTLFSTDGVGFSLSNAGATLTHFGITSSDVTGNAALSLTGATADRVYSSGGADSGTEGCVLGNGATLRNSVCTGAGFAIEAGGPVTLQGVTAWSTGSMGIGFVAKSGSSTVRSSILQGATDVATSDVLLTQNVSITLTYSNYDTEAETMEDPVTDPGTGTNQDEDPLLANPDVGDFHQTAASPTIDKGAPVAAGIMGPFDIDGGPRSTGAGPDIGADEIAPPPGNGGPGPGDGNPTGGNGGTDNRKPSLTALAVAPSAFRPLTSGSSIPTAARGTRVLYELSERANVAFRVERARPGRRVRGRCVRPTRRNRTRRRCVRWVRIRGGFTHAGVAGANSFGFSGRVRGRALRAGRYRLVARPVDLAGNRGKLVRRGFRILRRR